MKSAQQSRKKVATAPRRGRKQRGAGGWYGKNRLYIRRAAWCVIVAALAVIIWTLPIRDLAKVVQQTADQLGPWGFALYSVAFLVMSIFSIPVWPMPFVAGALFGAVWGTVVASGSCAFSAAVCFFIARGLRRTWLGDWLEASPRMQAMERVIEGNNWRIVAAVRLSHFLTFGLQNYAFGLTRIGFWPYLIMTWLITLPGNAFQVYLGDIGFMGLESWGGGSFDWKQWALRISGLIVMAVAIGYLGYRVRLAYKDAVTDTFQQEMKGKQGAASRRWPWGTAFVSGLAVLLLGLATWCVVQREELRNSILNASREIAHDVESNLGQEE